jgi:hypothetical protein
VTSVDAGARPPLDMESGVPCLALDIIGLGVFNYDFGLQTTESPIKAVYRCLREAVRSSPPGPANQRAPALCIIVASFVKTPPAYFCHVPTSQRSQPGKCRLMWGT